MRLDQREALTEAVAVDYTVVEGSLGQAVRDQAFGTSTDSGTERDIITVLFGANYAFTPKLSFSMEGRYRQNDRNNDEVFDDSADTYIVEAALRYDFTPTRF